MTTADETAHHYRAATVVAFFRRASIFWSGPTRTRAFFLTAGLMLVLIANVLGQLCVNLWHGWFFGSLEDRDAREAGRALGVFVILVFAVASIGVGIVWFRETLQVRWRETMTRAVVDDWLAAHDAGRSSAFDESANPEYRIADDIRLALEPVVDLAIGLFSAALSFVTFVGVLWRVGGDLTIEGVTIPAYMVLGAVLYGVIASALMLHFGRKLPRRIAARNAEEARLRFALTSARTGTGEAGSSPRRKTLHGAIDAVVGRWVDVVLMNARLTWITNGSTALIPIIPLMLAAPKYFADEFGMGQVVQLAAAFVAVQTAISWLVDHYRRIAECYASVARVVELDEAIFGAEDAPALAAAAPTSAPVTP